jgi:hypothetical protein
MDSHINNNSNQYLSDSTQNEQDQCEQPNIGTSIIQRYNFDITIEYQQRRSEPHMHANLTGIDNINIIN